MKDHTKHFLIWIGVLLVLIGLLALSMFFTKYAEQKNVPVKQSMRTTILEAPDAINGTDLILTECAGAVHVVVRYRIPPIGETALKEIGWIKP